VDPQKRRATPDFYGYIPDGGSRTVIFGCMMLNSALLLLIRGLSAAMLMVVNKRYFVGYMAGDMALYLLQKVLRGDFHYWLPVDGAFGLFMSLMVRVIVKILTDFTGVIQFRGDAELGGLFWTANMFLAVVASFVCVWISDGGRTAWMLVGGASGAWVMTFALFLLLMKKEYRRTFWSTRTGKQWTMNFFLKGGEDGVRKSTMGHNKKQWREIRGDVKEWALENWWRWEEERPAWFTEAWIAKVPPDMIPEEAEAEAKGFRESARRRSSPAMVAREESSMRVHPIS